MIQDRFIKWGGDLEPLTPKSIRLKNITLKSNKDNSYQPRFSLKNDELIIHFGHYWGGGIYYFNTIREHQRDKGLNLYGGDDSGNSDICALEMNRLLDWMEENEEKLKEKLKILNSIKT